MTCRTSLAILCCLSGWLAQAQPASIHSLRQQLTRPIADSTRSRLLCELGEEYAEGNIDSCYFFLNQSLQLAQRSHDSTGMARAMYQIGFTNHFLSKEEAKAIQWLNQAITVAQATRNYAKLANCYQLLAIIAFQLRTGDWKGLLANALAHAQNANDWHTLNDLYSISYNLYLAGDDDYAYAEKAIRQAMVICRPHNLDLWFTNGLDYCDLLAKQGKQAQSLALARQLAQVKDKLPKTQGEFIYTNDVARLAKRLGNYADAERIVQQGIAYEQRQPKPDTLHLYHYYDNLRSVYAQQGNWQKAYQQSDQLTLFKLWLQRKRQTRDAKLQMTQQQAQLDKEKQTAEIALLAEQQKQQRLLLIGSSVLALLLVGFVLVQRRNQQRIEQQRAELSTLNATKDKLFAIVSHDLRSPVANLHNNLTLTNWGALNQEEFTTSTRELAGKIDYLRVMLDNVLNWSILQMGGWKPRVSTIPLLAIVEQEIQLLQPLAMGKGVQLIQQVPMDARLYIDPNQLAVILRNLLQNALKFTNPGGEIALSFTETAGRSLLSVRDTGIGMDLQLLDNLFRLDKQNSRLGTASEQGTGLGLVLVKELVKANEGQVQVVSEAGKGTTFTLVFRAHHRVETRQPVLAS